MTPFDSLEWLSLASWYEQAPWTIDGLVYLVLFTGIAKVSLGRRFEGRGGAAVIGATGLALAIGATTLSVRHGFTLARLGPIAWAILLTLLGLLLFDLCRSAGLGVGASASVAVLALGLAGSGFGLQEILIAAGLASLFGFAMLLAALLLIWKVLGHLGSGAHGSIRRPPHGGTGDPPEPVDRARIDTLTRVEASVAELIDKLERRVRSRGIDHHAEHLLTEIARRERIVTLLYKRTLRDLARRHWRAGGQLADSLRTLLLAAQENVSAFERVLDVARSAMLAGNTELLLQALAKLREIEGQGIRLAQSLREHLRQADAQPQGGGTRGRP